MACDNSALVRLGNRRASSTSSSRPAERKLMGAARVATTAHGQMESHGIEQLPLERDDDLCAPSTRGRGRRVVFRLRCGPGGSILSATSPPRLLLPPHYDPVPVKARY